MPLQSVGWEKLRTGDHKLFWIPLAQAAGLRQRASRPAATAYFTHSEERNLWATEVTETFDQLRSLSLSKRRRHSYRAQRQGSVHRRNTSI
jgi:hypothetical protein